MRHIDRRMLTALLCAMCITPHLHAQSKVNSTTLPASAPSGRSVGEFLAPDGRFDLESARKAGFQGSLNMDGFKSNIDPAAGQPVFSPGNINYNC
jgi:hypothetical protein